jgi:hypothetical protein
LYSLWSGNAVPLYRFDWALGEHRVRDATGVELPDDDAARQHAIIEIRELLETRMDKGLGNDCGIDVWATRGAQAVHGELPKTPSI